MIRLDEKPFYLDKEQIDWVKETLASLNEDEKIGQLFCEICHCKDEEVTEYFADAQPGGVMFRPNSPDQIETFIRRMQAKSKVPMLFAANLERGGNGALDDGTYYGSQMQIAATDDAECGRRLGVIAGREANAVGLNWSFAPIVDIDYNYFSPVTNARTYGSDPDRVLRMAKEYLRGIRDYHVAATIKHFPGDGMDFRDQHKICSVNTMSVEQWDQTYGKVYKACIDEGAECVMVGHIKSPAYSKYFDPEIADADILPGSLSQDLLNKLLREKLGFNGLIVSDDTHMAGFMTSMERKKAVPACIAAGIDMFLFTVNHSEDLMWMKQGVRDGVITPERLDEAVTRILALKAKLLLNKPPKERTLSEETVIGCKEHAEWARDCADKAVTLVKDTKGLLPITPEKYPRILLHRIDYYALGRYDQWPQYQQFKQNLIDAGFVVDELDLDKMPGIDVLGVSIQRLREQYDLMIYYAGARSGYRIAWKADVCGDIPNYVREIPTMAISFGSPYLLLDMAMISTYVNAYSESEFTREAVFKKITGQSEFKGKNPVDPFCGLWDTRL